MVEAGGVEKKATLKIRKLLKTQNGKNAKIVEKGINWNVSGTWNCWTWQ